MPARLFLVSGGQTEPESPFVIPTDKAVVVGRGSSADLILLDRETSREHFRITHDGSDYLIEDLGSINGTLVNDEAAHQIVPLHDGDIIQAGNTTLRFSTSPLDTQERVLAEEAAKKEGSSVIEAPPDGGANIVHVELSPVDGAPEGAPPRSILAFRWWKIPFYPILLPLWLLLLPIFLFGRGRWLRAFARHHPDHTVRHFYELHPKDMANQVSRWWQVFIYLAVLFGALVLLNWHPLHALHVFHVLCAFYLIVIVYKLVAVTLSVISPGEIQVSDEEIAALTDDELPVYTILVPLYHETEVASKVIRYISRFDYPQEKLDVKLLLEEDDDATIAVCRDARLPDNYEIVIVPDSVPKTKPKACNHGLERAKGEFLVIYDGEDRPEHDQLKKAIIAFRKANEPRRGLARLLRRRTETVCLQAKLNYFNPTQNSLTRWFTIEYSTWFDLFLPGLHRLGSPIPLGGTSNHFKTSVLKFIGGWDPFNVTEDCDLGIRLHKMGFNTRILDSTTWEEANSQTWNWVRQRSRWVKGYIQTHLVHMRNPIATVWKLGPAGTAGFLSSVGGLSLMLLLNPIFWGIVLFYGLCWVHDLHSSGWSWEAARAFQESYKAGPWPWDRWLDWTGPWVWQMWFDNPTGDAFWNAWSQFFFVLTAVLFLGNVFFVLMHVWACLRRRLYRLIPHAILSPFYWVLISIGAWKGFLQLFTNPFKWEKTHHGLDTPQTK
ncbi:glycosyltransferase [Planctomycetota bacterium]